MKGSILLAGTLVAVIFAATVWATYLHPSIRPATEAQIRAVVPAKLLASTPDDPAAQSRFDRFVHICELMRSPYTKGSPLGLPGYSGPTVDSSSVKANGPLAASAMSLVRAGPLQGAGELFTKLAPVKLLAKDLAMQATLEGKSGESAACERAIEDGLDLGTATRSAGGEIIGYLVYEAIDATAIANAADCIRSGWLKPADLRRLIGAVKQYGLDDEELKSDYRQDLQRALFDKLSGLVAAGKELQNPKSQTGEHPQVGNFDALATASTLARVYSEWIDNAGRPWNAQVNIETTRADDIVKTLPEDPDSSGPSSSSSPGVAPEPPSDVEKLMYRMKMNAIPNSWGIALFGDFGDLGRSSRGVSIKASCLREMLRALAAVWAYKEDHAGKYPASLGLVVASGYLQRLPMDWFSQKPLLYNPRTHAIYSVGQIMADNGGDFIRDAISGDGNIGFSDRPRAPQR